MVSPDVVGIGSEYFVVYFRVYIYVRLTMSGHLFFCIYFFNVWYITCYPKWEALEFAYKVIGEALVLGLLVVVYKIPYSSCMWTRQDVIGVFPSYYCLSGATCVPVIVQYITTSLLQSVVYLVQRAIAPCVVVTWFTKRLQSLYLSRMNSQRGCWVCWKSSNTR